MSKAVRKIIYDLAYNPVEEYWEKIKHKPLFQKIENLKREIFIIKKEKELDEVKLKAKENELEELHHLPGQAPRGQRDRRRATRQALDAAAPRRC